MILAMVATSVTARSSSDLLRNEGAHKPKGKNSVPASNAFVPAAAGIVVGGEVVKDLIGWEIYSSN